MSQHARWLQRWYTHKMAMSVEVGIKDARAATSAALQALGWSVSDANVQAEVMMYAELRGSNQGEPQPVKPKASLQPGTKALLSPSPLPVLTSCTHALASAAPHRGPQ